MNPIKARDVTDEPFGTARLKCQGCDHSWETPPGPNTCPACGHDKIDWENYGEWREEYEAQLSTKAPTYSSTDSWDSRFGDMMEDAKGTYILLDLDGVLTDFSKGVARLMEQDSEELESRWPRGKFQIEDALGISFDEFSAKIREAGEDFWVGLDETPWARRLIKECESIAPVYYLTAPMAESASSSCAGKIRWFEDRFPGMEMRVMIGKPKFLCASPGAILVDDADHNVDMFRSGGGKAVLFPAIHNSAWEKREKEGDDVVWSVIKEVRDVIDSMAPV